jgi:hypothetical protein
VSELQLGLLGIGAAVIVLVLGYNKWQEWKFRKQSAKSMPQPDGDALMGQSFTPRRTATDSYGDAYGESQIEAMVEPALVQALQDLPEQPAPPVPPVPPVPSVRWDALDAQESQGRQEPQGRQELPAAPEPQWSQEPRFEPRVDESSESAAVMPTTASDSSTAAAFSAAVASSAASSAPALGLIDARFDLVMEVALDADTPGDEVVDGSVRLLEGVTRLVQWEGYNPSLQAWEGLHPSQRYRQVRAGLQLVDRRGATPHAELHRFAAGMDAVASALGGRLSNVDLAQVAARAATLDATCGEVDIQIALRISAGSGGSFAGTRLRALVEANGLVLEHDGRYRRRNDDGVVLFSLTRADGDAFVAEGIKTLSLSEVLLEMDVPRVPSAVTAFGQYQRLAQALADGLNAQIVDDNRRPLSPAAFDAIRKQVMAVNSTLQDAGIGAGSRIAQRLFS